MLAFIIGMSACGKSESDPKNAKSEKTSKDSKSAVPPTAVVGSPVETEAKAIEIFQSQVQKILEPTKVDETTQELLKLLADKTNISAKKINLHECYKNVKDVVREDQYKEFILYGKPENVGFLREAWEIELGKNGAELSACLEVRNGELKVLWRTPENAEEN